MFKRLSLFKRKRTSPRLYNQLHNVLVDSHRRKPWLVLGVLAGLGAAALSGLLSRNAGVHWITTILLAFYEGSTAVLVVMGVKILNDVIDANIYEEKMVTVGLAFLAQRQLDEDALETVKERATMGATAGQLKAIMPVLIFSTMSSAITRLITDSFAAADPLGYRTVGVAIIALFGFIFLLTLDGANRDAVIVAVIAEHRYEQRRQACAAALPIAATTTPLVTSQVQSTKNKSAPVAKSKPQQVVASGRKSTASVQSQPRKRRK